MATLYIPTVPNKLKPSHPLNLQFYQIAIGKLFINLKLNSYNR